ncbi:glycogen debranching enzyme GlgX [Vibrio sp. UCD-FRSSP16_10]|uniref:glycogen debranching protein GlgX n=1 Tax=unclassified Vibrio TaxID=2614977 RepID=UPI0007FE6993|nr:MULTISPECIES: glycogen debranching protein GlgX [unclassified Vibrio]OBT16976.1 glycogen debranching enzyme GlgX [Vibrio sp. UCD-FRSSP16_30]OBT21967.1 glycogen debranching enzyme GlgX [Vibrio sp. UCD-FRSSP16_10]
MSSKKSRPYPLGAELDKSGCNFSIHAPSCKEIALALFDSNGKFETYPITESYAGIKHIYVEGVRANQQYGFIVCDQKNEQILLSDPYAKALSEPLSYQIPFSNDKSWSMAKSVVISSDFDWQDVEHPRLARSEIVLFETHTKGLTQLNQDVPAAEQGKYLGLASDAMLDFYKEQNINCLQLLPVAACMHEPHLLDMGKVNYWGYNPYVFMAPDPRYAATDAVTELKTTIRELHKNGIEVILDVVYNHTAESGDGGPVFNLKLLDGQYYLKHGCHYANFTGCGNTVDLNYQPALTLVMDTLRYWVQEYKIDGFRFDLAATLGRNGDNFNREAAFFKAVAQDPILKETKLIAEPWDIGPNGYQVGNFPDGWNECNDKFRDITRSFWRGDQGFLKEFATRIMGSRDLYSASRWPHKMTINYITYHDGFTMQDLVSYKMKHNEDNGEHNHDGHGDNRSDNLGVEGATCSPDIIKLREKRKRNFMSSLLFSFSIPHILTADVVSHSQKGNNNAYCQDNELSWLNWQLGKVEQSFKTWLSDMLQARQQHMVPFIEAFSGESRNDNRVSWHRPDGNLMEMDDWNQLNAVSLKLGIGTDGAELLYYINQSQTPARFKLPEGGIERWQLICDTAEALAGKGCINKDMLLQPQSMVILKAESPAKILPAIQEVLEA